MRKQQPKQYSQELQPAFNTWTNSEMHKFIFIWNTMQIISIEGIETPSENKISNQKLVWHSRPFNYRSSVSMKHHTHGCLHSQHTH